MRIIFIIVLAVSTFAACHTKSSDYTHSAPLIDACSVLTKELAEDAIGEPAKEAKIEKSVGESAEAAVMQCFYAGTGTENFHSASLLIRRAGQNENTSEAPQQYETSIRKQFGTNHIIVNVQGLGESALLDPAMKQFIVFQGRNMFVFSLTGFPPEELEQRLMELAVKSLKKKG